MELLGRKVSNAPPRTRPQKSAGTELGPWTPTGPPRWPRSPERPLRQSEKTQKNDRASPLPGTITLRIRVSARIPLELRTRFQISPHFSRGPNARVEPRAAWRDACVFQQAA